MRRGAREREREREGERERNVALQLSYGFCHCPSPLDQEDYKLHNEANPPKTKIQRGTLMESKDSTYTPSHVTFPLFPTFPVIWLVVLTTP